MLASASVPVFAEGSALPGTTQETVTNPDGTTTEITTTTTVKPGESSGTTDVTIVIDKTTEGTTTDGVEVNGNDHREEHKTVDSTRDNLVTDSSMSEYGSETRTEENGREVTTGYAGGSEMSTKENGIDNVTVEVPLGGKDNVNSATGRPAGTETVINGEKPVTPGESDYHYTTETVVKPGEVTVTTGEIILKDKVPEKNETDLKYVVSETLPDETNDLNHVGAASEEFLPGYEGETVIPEGVPGYDYVYVGSGNTSKFFPAVVYDSPLTDEQKLKLYGNNAYIKDNSITWYFKKWLKQEDLDRIAYTEDNKYVTDAEGYILDIDGNRILKEERTETGPNGETTYLHRFDNYGDFYKVEGWFENGEWVKELNGQDSYYGVWAGPQQFILVDKKTGETITAYCADSNTPTEMSFGYNIENLEDADYYSDEQAAMIRSIAANGYWGTLTEEGSKTPEIGSLEYMKQNLLASGKFTETELASLNDGVALTATQMAIWSCSNNMDGIKFVNAHYSNWGIESEFLPSDKEDEVTLMFKLYDYLMNLEPTKAEDDDGKKTTANTVINAGNFIDSMDITVIEKAKDHDNNKDTDDTNDAYVTDITFSLVVTPSTANGDDLIVRVFGYDANNNEYEVASGRIAGTNDSDEDFADLAVDENGNYTFNNIILTEGGKTFNITLEGIQNLERGVYLYSSEIRTENDGSETSSQTLVGLAEGSRAVNVEMSIDFSLSVEDEIIATEHVWHTEWIDDPQPPKKPETPEEEPETPEEEPKVPEEEPKVPEEEPKEEPEVPAEDPKEEPEVTAEIEDEEIPLVRIPEDAIPLTDIPDEPVPQTGDNMFWYISTVAAAAGVFLLNLLGKKEKKNHNA